MARYRRRFKKKRTKTRNTKVYKDGIKQAYLTAGLGGVLGLAIFANTEMAKAFVNYVQSMKNKVGI